MDNETILYNINCRFRTSTVPKGVLPILISSVSSYSMISSYWL